MKRLLLIGAGGHGRVVAEVALAAGWTKVAFLDEAWPERCQQSGWEIVGTPNSDAEGERFVSIGNNIIRAKYMSAGIHNAPRLVHPFSCISPSAELGPGVVVMPGVVVNACARIGRGVILNTGCSIDHDCQIGSFVHVAPGAHLSGDVHVGDLAWIGVGASIREGIRIGARAFVAAGAAVINEVAEQRLVCGVPALDVGASPFALEAERH